MTTCRCRGTCPCHQNKGGLDAEKEVARLVRGGLTEDEATSALAGHDPSGYFAPLIHHAVRNARRTLLTAPADRVARTKPPRSQAELARLRKNWFHLDDRDVLWADATTEELSRKQRMLEAQAVRIREYAVQFEVAIEMHLEYVVSRLADIPGWEAEWNRRIADRLVDVA